MISCRLNLSFTVLENTKTKTSNRNNEKETGNKRLNNFINSSNSNILNNRYYSTNTSNDLFKNFVKKQINVLFY